MSEFTLNGETVTAADDHPHLLAALRDELGVTSPKDGCSPSGQCGCCTVLVDGKARVARSTPLDKVAGAEVVTLEGLPEPEVERYAEAFAACGALQCGFCTPGMVMYAGARWRENPQPWETESREYLEGNLCRCTGYHNIVKAVQAGAQAMNK